MLRVYSILYLEQVWSRPSEKERNQVYSSPIEEITEDESNPCSDGTITITSHEEEEGVIGLRSCQSSLTDKTNTITTYLSEAPLSNHGENTMFGSTSEENDDSSLSDVSVTEYIVHPPEEEKGEEEIKIVNEEIKVPITMAPPTPPKSSHFSPKKILHRAKSSITDESIKMIARRKSFFMEKFNNTTEIVQENLPEHFPLPPSPPLKGLRRQSSRLTLKGKKLTKKLKRALSFHQDSPLHHS